MAAGRVAEQVLSIVPAVRPFSVDMDNETTLPELRPFLSNPEHETPAHSALTTIYRIPVFHVVSPAAAERIR